VRNIFIVVALVYFGYYNYSSPHNKLGRLITAIETQAQFLEEKYTPEIEKINNKNIQDWLFSHFRLIRGNKANSLRNYFDYQKIGGELSTGFIYGLLEDSDPDVVAQFQSVKQMVAIPSNFDQENLFHWIGLAHELFHVEFDEDCQEI